jgi:hypothetical protein
LTQFLNRQINMIMWIKVSLFNLSLQFLIHTEAQPHIQ